MKRILIVDDQPHVIRVLRLCLERDGYTVASASDGTEALSLIRAGAPDVLITDIQMAPMSGRELCQALHLEFPKREFLTLVMTSMTAREERDWVRQLPATEFVEKPLSPRALLERLARHFSTLSEESARG
ncbi:MAG TPA: response regulator [Burkholderiaceae bacterium]|jgi:CheY-like chemotaxis protein|nr:response regulator [Burkholderiaceae bacterium]